MKMWKSTVSASPSGTKKRKPQPYKKCPAPKIGAGRIVFELLSGVLHDAAENIHTLINAQDTGIQGNVVVLGHAPGTAGVMLIVDAAALILFVQTLLGASETSRQFWPDRSC